MSAQMAAPRARCRETAQAARVVQIWKAPTMTWTTYRAAAVPTMPKRRSACAGASASGGASASDGASPCASRAARHVATAAPSMMSPTMKATTRWAKCAICRAAAAGSSEKRRDELAVHERPVGEDERGRVRGDVGSEEHEGVDGPGRERDDERQALAAAVRGQHGRIPRAHEDEDRDRQDEHRDGQMGDDRLARVARLDGPLAKPGLDPGEHHGRSRRGQTIDRGRRCVRQAATARPSTRKPTSTPHQRWMDSIQALSSPIAGMIRPLHSGQSGQPRPDPVLRTTTPMTIITKVATTVERASFWKPESRRFMGSRDRIKADPRSWSDATTEARASRCRVRKGVRRVRRPCRRPVLLAVLSLRVSLEDVLAASA